METSSTLKSVRKSVTRDEIIRLERENEYLKNMLKTIEINRIYESIEKYNFRNIISDDENEWIDLYNNFIVNILTINIVKIPNIYLSGSSIVSLLLNIPLGGTRDIDIVYFSNGLIRIMEEGRKSLKLSSTKYISGMVNNGIIEIIKAIYIISKVEIDNVNLLYKTLQKLYNIMIKTDKSKYIKKLNILDKTTELNYDIITVSLKDNMKQFFDNRVTPLFGSKSIIMKILDCDIELSNIFHKYIMEEVQLIFEPTLVNILIFFKGLKIFNTFGVYRDGGEYLPLYSSEKFMKSEVIKEIRNDITDMKVSKYLMKHLFQIGDPILVNSNFSISFYICGELLLMDNITEEFKYIYGNESIDILNKFKKIFGPTPIINIINGEHDCICPICQDYFKLSSPIIITSCNHYLHLKCYIEQVIPYINYIISIYDEDKRNDIILPYSNQCPYCRKEQFNIDWKNVNPNRKTFISKRKIMNGVDKNYALLCKNKGKLFNSLFIEDLSIFNKFKTMEEYLIYKWKLIERMSAFENISKDLNEEIFEELLIRLREI